MARNTTTELELIFETSLTDPQLQAFLDHADIIVTNTCATSKSPYPVLSASELKVIEVYVAAHLACLRDPISLRAKLSEAESWNWPASVTTAWGQGLKLSPYGQMAIAADRSGLLASLGKQRGSFRASPREDSASYTESLTKS